MHQLKREHEATTVGASSSGGDSNGSPYFGFLGLAPTVEMLGAQAKPAVAWIIAWPWRPLLATVLGTFSAVAPRWMCEGLMKMAGGATEETVAVATDAARRAFYENYLGLANDEMHTLLRFSEAVPGAAPTPWEGVPTTVPQLALGAFLRELATPTAAAPAGALRMLYVHNDEWVPLDYVARLQLWLDSGGVDGAGARSCRIMADKSVPHAFVSTRAVAETTASEAAADMAAMSFADSRAGATAELKK